MNRVRMKRSRRTFLIAAAMAATTAGFASETVLAGPPKFTLSYALKQGDSFAPYGTVSNINDVFINNNGDWLVDVSLTGGTATGALVKNGQVVVAVGDLLPPNDQPVTALTNLLKHLNSNGDFSYRPSLSGTPNSGLYVNTTPWVMNGQISTSPDFSANTPFIGFFRGRLTDDNRMFAIVSVDDPAIATTVDRALVWFSRDGKGNLAENVLFKEGDAAPGTDVGVTMADCGTATETFAITQDGNAMFIMTYAGAATTNNAGLYYNNQLVVRRGDESPISGVTYSLSSSSRCDVASEGKWVLMSALSTGTGIFTGTVGRGTASVFKVVGDVAPGTAETISSFGTGIQQQITDSGDVYWYAQFSGDTATNQAIYRNDQMLIRKGVTQIGADTVTNAAGTTSTSNGIGNTLVASKNGRFAITRSVINSSPRAAIIIEFDQDPVPCVADIHPPDAPNGVVNVGDLLEVISNWGVCTDCPPSCNADVTEDCNVNVADLLAIITAWGNCPQ